jgi:hypothetical protein
MPTKVRGRSTVSRRLEVCLPMAAGQKNEPPQRNDQPGRSRELNKRSSFPQPSSRIFER